MTVDFEHLHVATQSTASGTAVVTVLSRTGRAERRAVEANSTTPSTNSNVFCKTIRTVAEVRDRMSAMASRSAGIGGYIV